MRDCLRIGCYDIVVLIRQVDEAGLQWAENALDKHLCLVTRPMLNDDLVCCKNAISKFMCIYLRSISKAPKKQNRRKCRIRTRGCPRGETVGPCNEWQETICTSLGKYFSNAARSGALTEVWPATTAPTLLAKKKKHQAIRARRRIDRIEATDEMQICKLKKVLEDLYWLVQN